MAHAKLSPSSAHRWTKCPGSIKAENDMKHQPQGSGYAAEGTKAHDLAETCLENGFNPFDVCDDQDMAHYVQEYIDYVSSFGGTMMIETRVPLSRWVPDSFGTADCIISDHPVLRVVDLKYGMGKKVYAENNLQGALYALGALDAHGTRQYTHVCIAIVQPRLDHIDEWTITIEQLLDLGEWISEKAKATLLPDAPRVPGEEQCQFCKARPVCPALATMTEELTLSAFSDETVDNLPSDKLQSILDNASLIKSWLASVEDYAKSLLTEGESVRGYKLVTGRGSRKWSKDESEIEAFLTENGISEAYEKKILTPAKAEKLLKGKKDILKEYILKVDGGPVLAKVTDKRKNFQNTLDDFEDLS